MVILGIGHTTNVYNSCLKRLTLRLRVLERAFLLLCCDNYIRVVLSVALCLKLLHEIIPRRLVAVHRTRWSASVPIRRLKERFYFMQYEHIRTSMSELISDKRCWSYCARKGVSRRFDGRAE